MMEWLRFGVTALFLLLSFVSFAAASVGNLRFGYMLNRIHAAGIGDTTGLLFAALAAMTGSGELSVILKLILLVVFWWFTSPVSTHFLAQIEVYTNEAIEDVAPRRKLK